MAKPFDWKMAGKYQAYQNQLLAICRDTLSPMKVGLEIIEWLSGEGREYFKEHLKLLGREFQKHNRVRVISKNAIEVNLELPPKMEIEGAKVFYQTSFGEWTKVEKRGDELWVDNRRVILYWNNGQKNSERIVGNVLYVDFYNKKTALHPNIMDALAKFPHLIPEEWKRGENYDHRDVFFWGVTFKSPEGNVFVRYLCLGDGQWRRDYRYLDRDWTKFDPAAILENN